ncbi:MAG: sporulation transcriptional regulator SpoIIID [Candidatus Onthoplasma sp.]
MHLLDQNERVIHFANYIVENNTTIRATARHFGIPKSTVHNELSTKLKFINYHLYLEVKKILENNFKIKHIHGGQSTKLKYEKLKMLINQNDKAEIESESYSPN